MTDKVVEALKKRIQQAIVGVPAETRAANLDGETTFLRPRPGAARMYPETDIPLIQVEPAALQRLRKEIPVPWENQVASFSRKYDLPFQLAEPMFDSERKDLFERVLNSTKLPARYVASTLVDTLLALQRDEVNVELVTDDVLFLMFVSLDQGKFAKEAFAKVLRRIAEDPATSVDDALMKEGLEAMSEAELAKIIDDLIQQNLELVRLRGVGAHSILMGKLMQNVRGKVDGKTVNENLSKRLRMFEGKG